MPLVQFMIDKKSLIDEKDARERTPLYYAIESENTNLVRLLFENERVTKIVPDALFRVAELGLLEVLRYMMHFHVDYLKARTQAYVEKHGCSPRSLQNVTARFAAPLHEYRDSVGASILHVAAGSGATSIVRFLIDEWHMDVEEKSALGLTPLFYAVMEGHEETAHLLLFHYNADVYLRTNVGRTALHYASSVGNINMVEWCLDKGLHPNEKDQVYQWTALHHAVSKNRLKVVKRLLDVRGVDIELKDKSGRIALAHAKEEKLREFLQEKHWELESTPQRIWRLYIDFLQRNARYLKILLVAFAILW
eukprot:CAMPEP_0117446404 /NCGR_PEP_ID=MMETSP0759-20121206/6323_1 /TAXON_ID=63605 /ORGANISM="Percolomonas cosmopolitus, Strain WS" /LENGTH=306 /DNA_ID=CAMNT_0005238669 /DNA_START=177 /DNA_END=1094 /DNA_ORIENTATION=-